MTRVEAEQLVHLLAQLEADPRVPPEFRWPIAQVRGLALAAMCLAPTDGDSHSRKVTPLRIVS